MPTSKFSAFYISSEFENARAKFFKKYKIPEEGKEEFVDMFINPEADSKPRQIKSKRLPAHSASSVGFSSSSRYKETRMSLPSLSTRIHPSSPHLKISRKVSEGAITRGSVVKYEGIRCDDESFKSKDNEMTAQLADDINDNICIFHHRCRSTSLDQPLNQFQILIDGSSTIVIADSNTIILHGPNAESVSQHQKIALKLLFKMEEEDIITRMANGPFLKELCKMMIEKEATPLEIGKGCVEVWLSFAKTKALKTFREEHSSGKLTNELSKVLVHHGYMEDEKELTVSIKEKTVDNKSSRGKDSVVETEIFSNVEGALEPINFMMSSYGCKDLEQLDSILSCTYENKVPLGGFTEHFPKSENIVKIKDDAPVFNNTLFPTLLHFAACHGLSKLCQCLVLTPGFSQALTIQNKDGLTPIEMVSENKPSIRTMLERESSC
ncbi:uncharacterized protein [Antedon mediterranea]